MGAARLWRDFLGVFQRIRSTLTLVIEQDGAAALEWVSKGDLPGGRPIRYAGVSLLGMRDGRIRGVPRALRPGRIPRARRAGEVSPGPARGRIRQDRAMDGDGGARGIA